MKQLFKKPSYYLISSAMDGNEKAIEKLLAFYDPYISKCCLRSLYDEYGNVYIVVDIFCCTETVYRSFCFFHNKNNESPVYTRLSSNVLHFISVFSFCKQLLHLQSRSQIPEEPDPRMPDSSGHQS